MPVTFDRIQIEQWGWSQCAFLTQTHRLMCNVTYQGHDVALIRPAAPLPSPRRPRKFRSTALARRGLTEGKNFASEYRVRASNEPLYNAFCQQAPLPNVARLYLHCSNTESFFFACPAVISCRRFELHMDQSMNKQDFYALAFPFVLRIYLLVTAQPELPEVKLF